MPHITIDDKTLIVPQGATILQAARQAGIDIPALCFAEGLEPRTSCMACVVKVAGWGRLVPACAVACEEGMVVASETDEQVRTARREAVELLLSEHLGDCDAPCQLVPVEFDPPRPDSAGVVHIPRLIRYIAAGEFEAAAAMIGPCARIDASRSERACRRARHDEPVAIELLLRYAARVASERGIERVAGPPPRAFSTHMGRLRDEELARLVAQVSPAGRVRPGREGAGYTDAEAHAEAARCLHCDCRAADDCKLRDWAEVLGARQSHAGERRELEILADHPRVIYEPGKCISCGLCVQVTANRGEPVGMAFVGRGFDVRVRPALGHTLAEAITASAEECVAVCPTGALAWRCQ